VQLNEIVKIIKKNVPSERMELWAMKDINR
jgi:hypothetical protein